MASTRTCDNCGTEYLCDLRSKRKWVCPNCGCKEVRGVGSKRGIGKSRRKNARRNNN